MYIIYVHRIPKTQVESTAVLSVHEEFAALYWDVGPSE
jgi:hypothetical protein